MTNPVVARCPICSEQLRVVRLVCESCGTRLEGSFSLGRFHALALQAHDTELLGTDRASRDDRIGHGSKMRPDLNDCQANLMVM